MIGIQVFTGFNHVMLEVATALIPLVIIFVFLQVWLLKFPQETVLNIIKGLILTFLGLSFFLQGVYIGFLPVGEIIGRALGALRYNWILVPVGFILGFVAVFAEPAVRVLNYEVEKASGGSIPQQLMLYTLSLGVGIAVALSMGRILLGFPLWLIVIPGYLLALAMANYSTPSFVAIAFDSGGVATGPMSVTFILTIALGVASILEGRNPLTEGFGVIALVALAPILSVLFVGLLYNKKGKENGQELSNM